VLHLLHNTGIYLAVSVHLPVTGHSLTYNSYSHFYIKMTQNPTVVNINLNDFLDWVTIDFQKINHTESGSKVTIRLKWKFITAQYVL
jgi:hypothetical protein